MRAASEPTSMTQTTHNINNRDRERIGWVLASSSSRRTFWRWISCFAYFAPEVLGNLTSSKCFCKFECLVLSSVVFYTILSNLIYAQFTSNLYVPIVNIVNGGREEKKTAEGRIVNVWSSHYLGFEQAPLLVEIVEGNTRQLKRGLGQYRRK